jgi:hypothetical protein
LKAGFESPRPLQILSWGLSMNLRTVTITVSAFIVFALIGFISIIALVKHDQNLGSKVKLEWQAFQLTPCTAELKVNCGLYINVFAFRSDGAVFTVASKLPPQSSGTEVYMPPGSYTFWIVTSGRNADGDLVLSEPGVSTADIPGSTPNRPVGTPEAPTPPNPKDDKI